MKLIFTLLLLSSFALAQNVGVKVEDVDGSEDTTIQIKKGNKANSPLFEITEGEQSIEGDAAPLLKEARSNWKKACADWKREIKELNQENSVLNHDCGTQSCATQAMETVCTSKAKYKLKVKIN